MICISINDTICSICVKYSVVTSVHYIGASGALFWCTVTDCFYRVYVEGGREEKVGCMKEVQRGGEGG